MKYCKKFRIVFCVLFLSSCLGFSQDVSDSVLPPTTESLVEATTDVDTADVATTEGVEKAKDAEKANSIDDKINEALAPVSNEIFKYVFAGVDIEDSEGNALTYKDGDEIKLPLILIWLVGSALLLTIVFKFINLRAIGLAFKTVRGKYSSKDDPGEITHFQALSAALSGTVGLGNIAGVAIAISVGGAGAVFWMVLAGFLGMTAKFCECTLGVKYRKIRKDGTVRGGAMYYLRDGLAEKGMAGLGKSMAVLFAIVCVGASVGAGNMFQVNQATTQFIAITASKENKEAKSQLKDVQNEKEAYITIAKELVSQKKNSEDLRKKLSSFSEKEDVASLVAQLKLSEKEVKILSQKVGDESEVMANFKSKEELIGQNISETEGFFAKKKWVFGLIVAFIVGGVIIGGIKSIAKVTEFLVPIMCGVYVVAAIAVLFIFVDKVPAAFGTIVQSAFGVEAMAGGMIGAFIQGIRRAAFSNEAGFGSAAIAHSAVKTKHPASEGLVALLEPLVDTVFVCTMTGLVIVVTGMHETTGLGGVEMTSEAFKSGLSWFPYVLTASVILFAISTMLSWSYYGEQAWGYIFGESKFATMIYKVLFCFFVVVGSAASLGSVLDFSDGLFFFMCLFNLAGVWMLYPVVRDELKKFKAHVAKVDSGQSSQS